MAKFNKRQQEIMDFLKANPDMSYTEIGSRFGLTKSAISGLVRRSREKVGDYEFKKYDQNTIAFEYEEGKFAALTRFQISVLEKRRAGQSILDIANDLEATIERVKWAISKLLRLDIIKPKEIKSSRPKIEKEKPIKLPPIRQIVEKPEPKVEMKIVDELPVEELFPERIGSWVAGPKTIDQLTMRDCRWMIDEETYCGQKVRNFERLWCANHYGIVYLKVEKKKVSMQARRRQNFQWSNRASGQPLRFLSED